MERVRNDLILDRAGTYFRDLEKVFQDLSTLQSRIIREMKALALEYRKEFWGTPLVLYVKRRPGNPRSAALYWGVFCRPPKSESRVPGARKLTRWTMHIARGLNQSRIFRARAGTARKAAYLEMDRRARALNKAFHAVTRASNAIRATLEARRDRRAWECGDLEAQAPELSPGLPPPLESALGAGWFMLLRMASVEGELRSLAERYRAEPAYRPLRLAYTTDLHHPYGRLRWLHDRRRLLFGRDGEPEENLTDRWMRKARIPWKVRRLLSPYEWARRRMVRIHAQYTKALGRRRRRAGQAITRAERLLEIARPRPLAPAGAPLGRPPLAL